MVNKMKLIGRFRYLNSLTLMELTIVLIIVGILSMIGYGQYIKFTERARGVEARQMLRRLRDVAEEMYMINHKLPSLMTDPANYYDAFGIGPGDDQLPILGECRPNYYFCYIVQTPADIGVAIFYAIRCTEGGKPPQSPYGQNKYLMLNTDFRTGKDIWTSNAGY